MLLAQKRNYLAQIDMGLPFRCGYSVGRMIVSMAAENFPHIVQAE
jgi:hypothetical protein